MIIKRSYKNLMNNLRQYYKYLNENVKFTVSDVIQETICQKLSLVKYFELKITDNQSHHFLRMLSKSDLPFSKESLRKSYLADSQKTCENLTMNLVKILRSFENRAPGIQCVI